MPIIGPIIDIIGRFVPDPDKQAEMQQVLEKEYTKQMELQVSVINKEADSGNWLTRNWRPLCMYLFMTMLTAYFIMYTIIPYLIVICDWNLYVPQDPGLNDSLVDVIKLGLGGYIASRGVEKTASVLRKK